MDTDETGLYIPLGGNSLSKKEKGGLHGLLLGCNGSGGGSWFECVRPEASIKKSTTTEGKREDEEESITSLKTWGNN